MRDYYIYRQITTCLGVYADYSLYKWLPFECICTVSGTKELYELFNNSNFCNKWNLIFHNSFEYDKRSYRIYWDFYNERRIIRERFLILDDSGNIRDYYELTDRYRKKHKRHNWNRPYRCHRIHNISEQRRSITPSEIKETKDEYGITMLSIKPKRDYDYWGSVRCCAISRGWKEQTKRRRQYKPKEMI